MFRVSKKKDKQVKGIYKLDGDIIEIYSKNSQKLTVLGIDLA